MNRMSSSLSALRRLTSPLLVVGITGALVAGGAAVPAYAYTGPVPPSPLMAPASVLTNSNTLSPAQYVQSFIKNRNVIPGKVNVVGGKLGMGLNGVAVAGAWTAGTTAGTWAAGLMGLPTSGDFYCDVATAFASSTCGVVPAEGYVPNVDMQSIMPGWVGGVQSIFMYNVWYNLGVEMAPLYGAGGQLRVAVVEDGGAARCNSPAWNAAGGTVQMNYSYRDAGNVLRGSWYSRNMACAASPNGAAVMDTNIGQTAKFEKVTFRGVVHGVVVDDAATYYPVGHPDRPELNMDPSRYWQMSYRCVNGSTGTSTSSSFQESGAWAPIPAATCPDDAVVEWTLYQISETGIPAEPLEIAHWIMPDVVRDWMSGPAAAEVAAETPVELVRTTATGEKVSCFSDPTGCEEWYADPQNVPDEFECVQGSVVYSVQECKMYGPTFNPSPSRPPYASPETGLEPPPVGTTTPTVPDPGTDSGECFPSGWGLFNPLEWVLKPVKCALSWAFVPSTATVTKIQLVQTQATTRAPIPQLRSIFVWLSPPDLSTKCGSFTIPIWFIDKQMKVLDSCDPNDPLMKMVGPLRTGLGAIVWVATLAPLAWWAWREYAPGAKGVA